MRLEVTVNEVKLKMWYAGGWHAWYSERPDLNVSYCIKGMEGQILFPSTRILRNLARKYLGSALHEEWREPFLDVHVKGGTTLEQRATFLGALAARSKKR